VGQLTALATHPTQNAREFRVLESKGLADALRACPLWVMSGHEIVESWIRDVRFTPKSAYPQ
jgi:hypothetical protein